MTALKQAIRLAAQANIRHSWNCSGGGHDDFLPSGLPPLALRCSELNAVAMVSTVSCCTLLF